MDTNERRRRPLLWVVLVLVIAAFAAAGCGDDDEDSASSGATTTAAAPAEEPAAEETPAEEPAAPSAAATDHDASVEDTIAYFSSPVEWIGPNEAVTPPKGKNITVIICGAQGATCVRVGKGAEAAAKAIGWDVKYVDGRGTPDSWNEAVRNAVASKTDGIVLVAIPPGLVQGAIDAAKKAGIPVSASLSVLGPPTDAKVAYDSSMVGRANSAFMVQDAGGKPVKAMSVREDAFQDTIPAFTATSALLPKYCDGCEVVKEVKFTFATAANTLPGDVAQALQSNPEINYIQIPFDAITPLISQGIRQAGMTGKVKIIGTAAEAVSTDAINQGDMVMALGTPAEFMGWQAVDALVRIFAGEPLPELNEGGEDGESAFQSNYPVQMRYVTKDNLPDKGQGWDGGFDYQSKFKELWGL